MNDRTTISSKLEIENGTLCYDNTLIQVKNISKVSVEPMEKTKFPFWALGGIIICAFLSKFSLGYGMLGILVFIIPIIVTIVSNYNLGEYISLSLNSGNKVYFTCASYAFLRKAALKIIESIKEGKDTMINLNNCTIRDSVISGRDSIKGDLVKGDKIRGDKVVGDKMGRDKTLTKANFAIIGEDIDVSLTDADWDKLENFFSKIKGKFHENDKNIGVTMAESFCKQKSGGKLKELFCKNKAMFQDILGSLASAGILEIIRRVTGIWFR